MEQIHHLIGIFIALSIFTLLTSNASASAVNLTYNLNASSAGAIRSIPIMSAPAPSTCTVASTSKTYSNTAKPYTLQSSVCATDITIDSGVTVITNNQSMTATGTFTIDAGGVLEGTGAAPGGGCAGVDCSSTGNSGTVTELGGGAGGAGIHGTYGTSGSGGGGANAGSNIPGGTCGTAQTCAQGGSNGGGGGGGTVASALACQNSRDGGGAGGGKVLIYAGNFLNYGTISVAGVSASNNGQGVNDAGGGGGGGYVLLYIESVNPSNIDIGDVYANGGNGGLAHSDSCGGVDGYGQLTQYGEAGGGGGGGNVTIYVVDQNIKNSIDTNAVNVNGGSSGACYNGDCTTASTGNHGTIYVATLIPNGCLPGITGNLFTSGSCTFYTGETITTTYDNGVVGNGQISAQKASVTSTASMTGNIVAFNNQNAQWLLTCPVTPNPSNTLEYMISDASSFVGGNRCLASSAPLSSEVQLATYAYWNDSNKNTRVANAIAYVTFQNLGTASISNLGYSGEANTTNEPAPFLSSNYNTQSYIFGYVPPSHQSGLWTWNAKYADLSKAPMPLKQKTETMQNLQFTTSGGCTYIYNFQVSAQLNSIQNANIPVPVALKNIPSNYIEFTGTGLKYYPAVSQPVPDNCAEELWADPLGEQQVACGGETFNIISYGDVLLNWTGSSNPNLPKGAYGGNNAYTSTSYPNDYITSVDYQTPGCIFLGASFCTNNNYYTFSAPTGIAMTENSPIYPYLLYNISIPSTETNIGHGTSDLNLSLDMYSPHNTFSPGNYLEPYKLSTGSGFFTTLHTSSGSYLAEYPINWTASNAVFGKPVTNFISTLSNAAASTILGLTNIFSGGAVGSFSNGQITQPSFITSSSNDHIYILNYTTRSTGCFIGCTGTKTTTFLYTMRFIPAGYFNISSFQPNFTEGSVTPSASSWNSIWTNYWDNIINIQSKNLYITNITEISSGTTSFCWNLALSCSSSNGGADFNNFIPTALTSDYAGDIFILGQQRSHTSTYVVSAIFSNKTYATNSLKAESGFSPVSQIAATPGGQYIYVSNSTGNVSMFKAAKNSITFAGYINLGYSNYTDNLSITSYLQHGGPYANSLIADAYSNEPLSNDINSNHVPIGIASYDGILYELDNWSFTVNGLKSSVLMLRAFSANGTEIPIKAQSYSDIIPNNVPTVDLSNGGSGITYFPPFGWPLSANISIGNGDYITYCAANCDFTPSNIPASKADGYLPIGPSISNQGNVGPNSDDMGFTSNFNGTMMILAHAHSYTYTTPSEECLPKARCTIYSGGNVAGGSMYTELLKFKPVVINYTRVSFAQNSTYSCFISNSIAVSNTPCTINYNIGNMYPPFTQVPSSFNYSTNEGSPTKYFSISSVLSSLFPTGISSSSSTSANSAANTGNGLTDNSATDIYNSANSLTSFGIPSSVPQTYINSTIRGYFLVPYTASYSLSESWSPQSDPATSSSPSSCSAYNFPSPTTINYNGYSVGQFNYTSNQASLNSTIQGGYSYAQYLVNPKTYYNASLSDQNLIFPGAVNLAMLTNKLFGNTYINQSVGRLNGKVQLLSNPYVINATRGLLYSEFYLNQTASPDTPSGFTFPSIGYPSYMLTQANVLNPIEYGAANAVLGDINPYPGSNNLIFINQTTPTMVNLYSLYKKASQLDLLFQGFPNNANVLGYNRFMYVFTDAFNNTIYMPLDVDLSNITSITLNPSVVINATNSNETEIKVEGTAGYYSGVFGDKYVPLPAGDPIYIYYDTNINFFNSSVAPPSQLYFNYSDRCAFASNATGCQYADPLSSVTQGGYYIKEADAPTFHTQYNDTPNAQGVSTCSPSASSLLSAHIPINCNVYGNYGLPISISASKSPNNEPEYCLPEFANGTGVLTSQMGLVGVVNTNNQGQFSEKFNVCGTGTAKIMAQYFGNPGPEPQIVYQPPIGESIGSYAAQNANSINTLEYAYTTSPNATAVSLDIGNYALGFGGISIGLTMVIAILSIIFLLSRRGAQNAKKR
ncbi:MAG: hypothetical protein M1364_00775 [Candidatus Marsarchaeota archaeon]|jgi:hypothetical protein|nr:hypothetical protein [Candidatus Marsarchaeota archaeon]